MKTKEKALKWYNGLSKEIKEELSLNYFGAILLTDLEIIEMYFEAFPHYTKSDVIKAMIWAEENGRHYTGDDKTGQKQQFHEWIKENLV